MKHKLLFLLLHGMHEGNGVSNKIQSQVNAFRHNGLDVSFSYLAHKDGYLQNRFFNEELIDVAKDNHNSRKYGYKYRYTNLYNKMIQEGITVVYIRYTHFANPLFIRFLSKLKKKNIKIFLEIPTYPYDNEYKYITFKQKMFLKVERISRKFFKYYCDKIVTVSEDKKIFGADTICISNGIDVEKINPKKINTKQDADSYRLLGVANVRFWHGYDRIIEGLNDYYSNSNPKTKVYFDLIGDNNDIESVELRALVEKYKLEEYVTFHGVLRTDQLDEYFDNANLAVGSLGVHRIGLKEAKPIKNREYCAKGIPFMYSMIDRDFDHTNFVLKAADDDTNIDINSIVSFLKNNNFSIETIRKYAEKNITWNSIVKKVIAEF